MKDSRIGTYGAAALVLSLGLRVLLLSELLSRDTLLSAVVLVASHAAGRAAAVVLMAVSPYAGDEMQAKARPLARSVRASDAVWATLVGGACLGFALGLAWQPIMRTALVGAALVGLVAGMQAWLRRRLGGHTGDTLGATEQFGELLVLLAFVATLP
jgi:adenosylcobinamide-GDP ribazoletransferase